nr:MAG TPA: hypothetical protein [Caudoviricetes sp.]
MRFENNSIGKWLVYLFYVEMIILCCCVIL